MAYGYVGKSGQHSLLTSQILGWGASPAAEGDLGRSQSQGTAPKACTVQNLTSLSQAPLLIVPSFPKQCYIAGDYMSNKNKLCHSSPGFSRILMEFLRVYMFETMLHGFLM